MTAASEAVSVKPAEIAWWREPTGAQWGAFGAAWVAWVLDAFDFTVFLLVMPLLVAEFKVSLTAAAGSVTLTLLLRLLGGLAAGAVADRYGRKRPLLFAIFWFAVCDAAIFIAPSFAWVLVFRTLFGFGMGAQWTSGATLAMENWPERSKAIASGLLQGSWAVGYMLAAIVSTHIVPAFGWRALFLAAAAPALIALPLIALVKEKGGVRKSADPIIPKPAPVPISVLFKPPHRERVIWAAIVEALGFGVYYAMAALWPTLLRTERGLDATAIGHLVTLFNIAMLFGSVACGLLAAKKGIAVAIWIPALLMIPLIPLYIGVGNDLLWLGALCAGGIGVAYVGITPLLLTGLFNAEVRARAVGLVYHVGAAAAALLPPLVATLHDRFGWPLSRSIGASIGICELLLAVALWLRPAGVLPSPTKPG